MFKATLSDVDLLRNSIPIIAEIIDEANFTVDKNGISMLAPDRTMVSVVDFRLLSSAFDEFKVEGSVSLGLNMSNLTSVLKRLKSGDKLTLSYDGKKLIIRVAGRSTRTFEIPLIDVKLEKPPIEQLAFNVKVHLDSSILEEGIADAEIIGDSVFFESDGKIFSAFAKGDISSARLEVKKGDEGLIDLQATEHVRAQYPLDYLKKMVKAGRLSPQAILEFGKDYPMRLDFRIIDKLQMTFILAPRVSEE